MTSDTDAGLRSDETLLFIHLPKTGGTALRSALRTAFSPDASAFIYGPRDLDGAITRDRFEALPADAKARLRLVMGHFRYGFHEELGRPYRYATIVRQPVDRVVSLYYHYRNLPGLRFGSGDHRERWRMRLRRVSLEDWVFSERRVTADNLMVRNVSGRRDVPFGKCSQGLYELAMEHVERDFLAVAVAEEMAGQRGPPLDSSSVVACRRWARRMSTPGARRCETSTRAWPSASSSSMSGTRGSIGTRSKHWHERCRPCPDLRSRYQKRLRAKRRSWSKSGIGEPACSLRWQRWQLRSRRPGLGRRGCPPCVSRTHRRPRSAPAGVRSGTSSAWHRGPRRRTSAPRRGRSWRWDTRAYGSRLRGPATRGPRPRST